METSVLIIIFAIILCTIISLPFAIPYVKKQQYHKLMNDILDSLGLTYLLYTSADFVVNVKSSKAVQTYDEIKFFKEYPDQIQKAIYTMSNKSQYAQMLLDFLENNDFKKRKMYYMCEADIKHNIERTINYYVGINYVSPAGRKSEYKEIVISPKRLTEYASDKTLLMNKTELNKYKKEQEKEQLEQKQKHIMI
jgi:hypothetical protein